MWSFPPTDANVNHICRLLKTTARARFLIAEAKPSAASGGCHSGMRPSGQAIEERAADGVVDVGERSGRNTGERLDRRTRSAVSVRFRQQHVTALLSSREQPARG